MAQKIFKNIQIQQKTGTAEVWKTKNPVLARGELGIEIDTRLVKVGDGTTKWNLLEYINQFSSLKEASDEEVANILSGKES